MMKFDVFKFTDKGPRQENEDSIGVKLYENDSLVACISDGVGGASCGKLASDLSVKFFIEHAYKDKDKLDNIILKIHDDLKLIQVSKLECKSMATTFTGCVLDKNILKGIQVGDSRLCILRGNGIKQLTDIHTEAGILLKEKKITFEGYKYSPRKNVLLSALGINKKLITQEFEFNLLVGDRILLTTDGVHEVISKKEFRDLSVHSSNNTEFGNSIINLINNKKIFDNVSFLVISIL